MEKPKSIAAATARKGRQLPKIKAASAILKKHPQARFVFVGDGPLFWMLRIYARYLNLDHAVRITGHLDQMVRAGNLHR